MNAHTKSTEHLLAADMAPTNTGDIEGVSSKGTPSPQNHTDIKPISQELQLRGKDAIEDDSLEQVLYVRQCGFPHDAHTTDEIGAAESLFLDSTTPRRSPRKSGKTTSNELRASIIHDTVEEALETYLRKCGYIVCYGLKGLCTQWSHWLNIQTLPFWVPTDKITFEQLMPPEFYGTDIRYYDEHSRIFGNLLHGAN